MTCLKHQQEYREDEYCIYCGKPNKDSSTPKSTTKIDVLSLLKKPNYSSMKTVDLVEAARWSNVYYAGQEWANSDNESARNSHNRYHDINKEMERRGLR